jgi:MFS family permease
VRRLLALVSAIIFVDALLFTALTPLVPKYVDDFNLSKVGAGLLVGAYGAGAIFGGIPGGLASARWGPKRTVVASLLLLAVASFAFASAGSALALGLARFVQGVGAPQRGPERSPGSPSRLPVSDGARPSGRPSASRSSAPSSGLCSAGSRTRSGSESPSRPSASLRSPSPASQHWAARRAGETVTLDGLTRAFADTRFVGGLWLNMLPAILFGVLLVLTPLALDDAGWGAFAIALVFFGAGLVEVVLNPVLGRISDRVGRLTPIRASLFASALSAAALAAASGAVLIAVLICCASISFGSLYTPSMSLASNRAEAVGLAQGLAFGVVNTAWALGELVGPTAGGALAESAGDAAPYLVGGALCALTLGATYHVAGRLRPSEA